MPQWGSKYGALGCMSSLPQFLSVTFGFPDGCTRGQSFPGVSAHPGYVFCSHQFGECWTGVSSSLSMVLGNLPCGMVRVQAEGMSHLSLVRLFGKGEL